MDTGKITDQGRDEALRPYLEPTSSFATLAGMRVHFTRTGSGPPIVLLHGAGASLHIFGPMVEHLATRFEVIRLDLPGFGLTGPRPDGDYRIETYVSLLDRFLAEQMSGAVTLVGHSSGGQIAWTYALDHPERLNALVLMNATGYPDKSLPPAMRLARVVPLRPILRRWGSRKATARSLAAIVGPDSGAADEAMVERVHTLMSLPGNRGAFVDFANTEQRDRSNEIPTIEAPTLVLRSDLIDGQHFADDIGGARDIELTGVGHLMPAEAPIEASDAILSFAEEVRADG